MLRALQEKRAVLELITRGRATNPTSPEPPDDPYAALREKLSRMPNEDLLVLQSVNAKELNMSEVARTVFGALTPEELIALARIMKDEAAGAYDRDDAK